MYLFILFAGKILTTVSGRENLSEGFHRTIDDLAYFEQVIVLQLYDRARAGSVCFDWDAKAFTFV